MKRDLILDRLAAHAATRPEAPALTAKEADGTWRSVSWADYHRKVCQFGAACVGLGLPAGGVVAILGENHPQWVIAALGAMAAGGVATGIYQTSTVEQIAYILGHSEALVLVLESAKYWSKVADLPLPKLQRVVFMDPSGLPADPRCVSFSAFLDSAAGHLAEVERRTATIREQDLGSLIYTSGTTGDPKGVMLTHRNLAWTAGAAMSMLAGRFGGVKPDDCTVSYLPLSHIAEQMFTIYLPVTGGYQVYFAGGIDKVKETLLIARPTFFLAVPRVWEKFKAAMELRLGEATGLKARIVGWARKVGTEAGRHRLASGETSGLLAIKERIARKLFFGKLKGALGFDRLRLAISGAAPISQQVLEFFLSLEIPIMEVYGQSEDTGPTSFNIPEPDGVKLGTVGRPIPGIEVKLAQDGEILVRGDNVFAGYYKDEAATAATLVDGWLHSGDVGEFDSDGFLRITDRKKDLIKTSGGKYIAPQGIEKQLKTIPLVSQAVVIAEGFKYVTALLTLEPDRARHFAKERGLPDDLHTLSRHPTCVAFVQEHVDRINGDLARYESIKRFTLLSIDFSVDGGELTPSQKVRRKAVNQRYSVEIAAMYDSND